jgi:thiosulfate dehydrogenase
MTRKHPSDLPQPGADKPSRGQTTVRVILAVGGGLALVVLGSLVVDYGLAPSWLTGQKAARSTAAADGEGEKAKLFTPPDESAIPDDEFGQSVRRGMAIFLDTGTNAHDFVGNDLSCSNCHLDAGRQAYSAPMWAAYPVYPKYRSKNKMVNTMEDRIKGCFTYSMNAQASPSGGPPPYGSDVYRDLQAYFFWMSKGLPTGEKPEGAGFGKIDKPEKEPSRERGEAVFAANCAVCHGADGQGQKDINGKVAFPPLWGPRSYNWGAGMHKVDAAAAFIKHNMPLSQPGKLSTQEAWDVAAFVDSHPRPKDPRQVGDITVEDGLKKWHHSHDGFYGQTIDGVLLGTGFPQESQAAAPAAGDNSGG